MHSSSTKTPSLANLYAKFLSLYVHIAIMAVNSVAFDIAH